MAVSQANIGIKNTGIVLRFLYAYLEESLPKLGSTLKDRDGTIKVGLTISGFIQKGKNKIP